MQTVKQDRQLTVQIAQALNEVQQLKVGMTRDDLLKSFAIPGGAVAFVPGGASAISRSSRTYVFRKCELIKITVEFMPVGVPTDVYGESGFDKITKISAPFLSWATLD